MTLTPFQKNSAISTLLVCLYFIQDFFQLYIPWLVSLQSIELYKYISGFAVFIFMLQQWILSSSRAGSNEDRMMLSSHANVGAWSAVLLYLHSVELGHAFLLCLSGLYLGNVVLGALNPLALRVRKTWIKSSWLVVHIFASMLILVLSLVHAYWAFYYK